mmetsp:Transcript_1770/g.1867  ORF Transcript_1770/g.1867 Transcript_1770/m.1867 type:complete len:619 (+) Transcript_1770:86-1942(+)
MIDVSPAPNMPPREAVPERPGTSMSVSDQAGFGEESMMSFINAHMTSILQPFAENVEELHKTVYSLSGSLSAIMVKMEASSSQINEHALMFPDLRAELRKTHELASGTESQLQKTISEKRLLEETVEKVTDSRIPKIENKLPVLKESINGLSQELADARNTIALVQCNEDKNRTGLVKINATGDRLSAGLSTLQQAHERTVEKVTHHKAGFDKHAQDMEPLPRDLKELRAKLDIFNQNFESRFGRNDERFLELQKQLVQYRQDFHQLHDAAVKMMCGRLDAHDVNKEEAWQKMKRLEVGLAEGNARTVENGENFNKLMRLMEQRHATEMHELSRNFEIAELDIREGSKQTRDIHNIIHFRSSEVNGETKHWLNYLQDEVNLSIKKSARLEKVLGLEEMTMENQEEHEGAVFKGGILLTEKQIADFKATFERYDTDRSGHIDFQEVRDVLNSLGHDPPDDILKMILNEIDQDKSGEVCFDEFCTLMSKMLDADGKVNVEAYLESVHSTAKREHHLDTMIGLIPVLQEDLKKSKEMVETERQAMDSLRKESIRRIIDLEEEVAQCRKGLDLTQEYWKGFSRGLKETKKNVRQEGEGKMLPSATKLRNLPPLDTNVRPTTR